MNPSADTAARIRFEAGISSAFAASFLTVGLFFPFFPVWLDSRGLDADAIGIVLAAQIALRVVVCPVILQYADRARDRADVLLVFAWAAAASVLLLFPAQGFVPILLATLVVAAVWSPVVPLTDAVALSGVRRLSIDYGRTRVWGSLAFIAANVIGGVVIQGFGVAWYLPLMLASFVGAALLTMRVPRVGRPLRPSPAPIASAGEPWSPDARFWQRGLSVLPKPDIRVLLPALLAIALVQSSHALFYGFGSIVWASFGYTATEIGILWALGVVAEVVLFRYASVVARRLGAKRFLILGGGVAVVRWSLFPFDLGFLGFALLQTTHAFSFGATHLALQSLIGRAVAESRLGAAQGTAFALQTGVMALATAGSGVVYAAFGPLAFLAVAALALVGTVIGLASRRAWASSAP